MRRNPRFPVIRARRLIQVAFFALVIVIGVQFTRWALPQFDGRAATVSRPPGVEGFLPISALMSLRLAVAGGGIHPVHPAALAILVAALLASAVVAKSFCSLLCPLGAVSEWLGRAGVRLLGATWTPPRWLDIPLRSLKYLLLAFFAWAGVIALAPDAIAAFLDSPYNRVADVKMLVFFMSPGRTTIAVVGVLVIGSLLIRDLWCRYLCPYGALLGLLGRLAPLQVTRDASTCIDCRKCTRACPARLPVHTLGRVASVECTSCQDCVAACPVKDCLALRPPRLISVRPLRPVVALAITTALWLAVVTAFRASGHWHSSVTPAEYAERLRDLDSPLYTHVGGLAGAQAPGETGRVAPLVRVHGRQ